MTENASGFQMLRLDLRRLGLLLWAVVRFGGGPLLRTIFRRPMRNPSGPVRMRLAFESLGITYLKLGQFLAMRFDLLPPAYCQELSQLFDRVPPMPFQTVKDTVEHELGQTLDRLFASFEEEPLAAGSVAQVHRARTNEGDLVAVKVQRPGIRAIFDADLRIFLRLSDFADAVGALGYTSMRDMVEDFSTWTVREMDFTLEGATADHLREDALPYEVVPQVHWDLTTPRVLTMEFLQGPNAIGVEKILQEGGRLLLKERYPDLDLDLAMSRLSVVSMRQLFITGFFHGDPHPGNVIMLPDSRVAFVDFGIFGELAETEREVWRRHFEAFAIGNIRESIHQYCKLLLAGPDGDLVGFQTESLEHLTRLYHDHANPDNPPEVRHVARSSEAILELIRKYRLRVTLNNLLFWRTLVALNASAYRLSPDFDFLGAQRTFFAKYRKDPLEEVLGIIRQNIEVGIVASMDGEAARFEHLLELDSRGENKINVLDHSSAPVQREHDRHARALTLGLVGLSFAIASTATPWELSWRLLVLLLAVPLFAGSWLSETRR